MCSNNFHCIHDIIYCAIEFALNLHIYCNRLIKSGRRCPFFMEKLVVDLTLVNETEGKNQAQAGEIYG